MVNKILGYSLIFLGLIIILVTLDSSYNIFVAKSPAPEIFSEFVKEKLSTDVKSQDSQRQIEEAINKQISGLIPPNSLPKILNLISWSILVGILILGGGQVAGIGIKLIAVQDSKNTKPQ